MLTVKTPDEVYELIESEFLPLNNSAEQVGLDEASGRILAEDIIAGEYVPGFDRSTVDGYSLRAADTFGCSDALPALLTLAGAVAMGAQAEFALADGCCAAVPTGGAIPAGADSVQMVEYSEDYGDGTVGILKPVAPGNNLIFKGDEVKPGQVVLERGRRLTAPDIGALAALGVVRVPVMPKLRVAVISTGDELVEAGKVPGPGQVRDVNSALVSAALTQAGAIPVRYGIVRDEEELLRAAVERALSECDAVLISGGSSVGEKDATARVMAALGEVMLHGIAMKPGKPTLVGRAEGKPVIGLPGHPVAALFVTHLFVCPLLARLEGRTLRRFSVPARLAEPVSANHGRAQYMGVFLERGEDGLSARPIRGKSGLITTLAGSDGYFCIPRDCEGLHAGAEVLVSVYTTD